MPAPKEEIETPEALTAKKSEFSDWYHQVIKVADIIDQRYPFQGFLVYKPYGYSIFERSIRILEDLLEKSGHGKVHFPALIPERLLKTEENHIKGVGGEVFWVTHAGERELAERAALSPTSETAMYEMLKLWVRSWRDLPVKIHQSVSVFRYETKHTRPLIRDREILWNESHTSHATLKEAQRQCEEGIKIYQELFRHLCIPAVWLSVADIFPGAESSTEPFTAYPDGRVLEMGSVNNLGQRFSRAFGVKFKKQDSTEDFVWQTCYGVSERLLSAVVSIHGDDRGLVIPPEVAPIQAIVVPIIFEKKKEAVLDAAVKIRDSLLRAGIRAKLDERDMTAGEKFYYWEIRGIPLRVEIGPKDMEKNSVMLVRRDTMEKESVPTAELGDKARRELVETQKSMLDRAQAWHDSQIVLARREEEIRKLIDSGKFVKVPWCGDLKCAGELEKAADARFIGWDYDKTAPENMHCVRNGHAPATLFGYIGKMY